MAKIRGFPDSRAYVRDLLLHEFASRLVADPTQEDQPFVDAREYLSRPTAAEPEWVVEGFLPESYLVVLGGDSKSGKSCLVTALAVAVASGTPFLGMATRRAPVLWCALEESETERSMILRAYPDLPQGIYVSHEKIHIDGEWGLGLLRRWIDRTGAKLIVVDPLYCASVASSFTDGRMAWEMLSGLKGLCRVKRVSAIRYPSLQQGHDDRVGTRAVRGLESDSCDGVHGHPDGGVALRTRLSGHSAGLQRQGRVCQSDDVGHFFGDCRLSIARS